MGTLLISEEIHKDNYEILNESTGGGFKYKGIFGEAERINKNKRLYSNPIMSEAVNKIQSQIHSAVGLLGEFNHPKSPTVNPENACIKITSLKMDGNYMLGEATVLSGTPKGDLLIGLRKHNSILPVSTRALGRIEEANGYNNVVGMDLVTVDCVYNQSCQSATPEMVMESTNWLYDIDLITAREAQMMEDFTKKSSAKDTQKLFQESLDKFLNGFSNFMEHTIKNLNNK